VSDGVQQCGFETLGAAVSFERRVLFEGTLQFLIQAGDLLLLGLGLQSTTLQPRGKLADHDRGQEKYSEGDQFVGGSQSQTELRQVKEIEVCNG
jgi:hypothetical protein